jgi:hypothetical protein
MRIAKRASVAFAGPGLAVSSSFGNKPAYKRLSKSAAIRFLYRMAAYNGHRFLSFVLFRSRAAFCLHELLQYRWL